MYNSRHLVLPWHGICPPPTSTSAADGKTRFGLPFLATMLHAAGLNVMNPSERKRDILDVSTKALRDMIAMPWLGATGVHYRRL